MVFEHGQPFAMRERDAFQMQKRKKTGKSTATKLSHGSNDGSCFILLPMPLQFVKLDAPSVACRIEVRYDVRLLCPGT